MKRKIILLLIIIVSISWIVTDTIIYINNSKILVNYKNEVNVEINSEIHLYDYIDVKKGKIETKDSIIKTNKLGDKKVKFFVLNKYNKKYEYEILFNIIDTQKPVIKYEKNLSVTSGNKIDLLKNVEVTDNSLEEIKVSVEGEYNINKAGDYTLYYVAKDSSGNEAREEFTLTVNKKVVPKVNNSTVNNNTVTNNNNETTNSTVKDGSFTTSKGFNGYTKNGVTYIDGVLIVNKTYSVPSSFTGGGYGKGLTKETYEASLNMIAAAKLDGYDIYVQSGYRSYNTQKNLYNSYVKNRGQAAADTFSARPGNSEHQTGLAFDVCATGYSNACINSNFNNTEPANWLSDNAYKYGFILRYPNGKTSETGYKYESWHFRYVGVDLATKLYNNGNWITLESYYGITSNY